MFNSLRTKLTLWYSIVLTLVLIAFALLFYFLIEQTVKLSADETLEDASDSLITRLTNNSDAEPETIRQTLEGFRFQYTVFAIYDRNGGLIAASPRLRKDARLNFPIFNITAEEIPKNVLDEMFQTPDSFKSFLLANKTNIRMFGKRADIKGQDLFIVTLRPLTNQTELLSNIRFIFIGGIPLALILSSLGGYYLARKSLEPVREMGEKASLITSRNLNERLPTGRDRDELEKLAGIFNQMLTRLETSFEQQRRFMADASHELRTPLAIIRGEAEVSLQKQTRTEEEYRESIEVIRQEGVRLSHIVEDLFTLARADAGQYRLNITTFYLDELVNEAARAVRTLIANKKLEFEHQTDENLIITGDETLLRRLLIILLDNAIKYAKPNGKVSLECAEHGSHYKIEVANTGNPIPETERIKIFERFYRADKARSHKDDYALGTGAGLGLSIGTWIARVHQGKLELVRSDESGTVFAVYLSRN
jgi:two-component system, OmpR family, sensor kinase